MNIFIYKIKVLDEIYQFLQLNTIELYCIKCMHVDLKEKSKEKNKTKWTGSRFTEKNTISHDLMACGRTLSTVSTSFENRLSMRPIGVVSNNIIPHRSTFVSKLSCIACADTIKPNAIINAFAKLSNTNRGWGKKRNKPEIWSTYFVISFGLCFFLFKKLFENPLS